MACTTTTTFAPCYCFDIKYYIDAGTFTLIHVDCSGNTIQTVYNGIGISSYITICSQCTPYTAFTRDIQTNDYVTITPRSILCIDSQPCPTTTTTTIPPTPTRPSGGGTGWQIKNITVCDATALCSRLCYPPLPPQCPADPLYTISCGIPYYCCCSCEQSTRPVYVQNGNNPVHPTTNPPYISQPTLNTPAMPYLGYWLYNGFIYVNGNQIYCSNKHDPCPGGCDICCVN